MLIKKHPGFEMDQKLTQKSGRIIYLPTVIDAQKIMYVSDILITDYSNVSFEFLILDRPMIFTPYDLENYLKVRNFYFKFDDMTPGPKETTFNGICNSIKAYIENPKKDQKLRNKLKKRVYQYPDGNNSKRVTKEIIKRL